MKNQKGVTLVSLVIYVAVMLIVLSIMTSVISNFYSNMQGLNASVDKLIEFNKFNIYFLKEVKQYNNKVDTINMGETPYILFSSGNSFTFSSNKIYYNNLEVCKNVKNIKFEYGKKKDEEEGEVEDRSIIKVVLNIDDFEKEINYKIENIY